MNRKILLFLLLPFFFGGCGKGELIGDFVMEYIEDFEIPAGIPDFGATFIVRTDIMSNAEAFFAANGVSAAQVKTIKASFISLQAINPPNENYDFLRDVTLLIETQNLPRFEVGYRENIVSAGNTLDLIPSITDLTQHLKSEKFDLVLQLEPDEIPQSFITTRLRVQFQAFLE